MFYLLNTSLPLVLLLNSVILILASSSWFTAWMALELNLMAFIPLLISPNKLASESALKYFFIQALGSIFIFFFMLTSFFYSSYPLIFNFQFPFPLMINFALLLKLGAAPFHFWFPAMIEGLTWNSTIILMTIQKIGPLSLLSMISFKDTKIILLFAMTSAVVGAITGMNQLMCRKIMSYSSIAHLGWLLCANTLTKLMTTCYFILYGFMSLIIVWIFKLNNSFHMNQIFHQGTLIISFILIFYLNLMSLGGLPPFLGFFPKWMVVKSSIENLTPVVITLILSSIITLYFYLRLTYSALMMMSFKPFLIFYKSNFNMLKFYILFPLLFLPVFTILY